MSDFNYLNIQKAYEIIKNLGFITITKLTPKSKFELEDIIITATSGAPVPKIGDPP